MGELPIMTDPIHTFGVRPHQRGNSEFQIPSSKFPAEQAHKGRASSMGVKFPSSRFQVLRDGLTVREGMERPQIPGSKFSGSCVRETRGVKLQVPASLKALSL